jgi:hypothetical protein
MQHITPKKCHALQGLLLLAFVGHNIPALQPESSPLMCAAMSLCMLASMLL